MPEVTEAGPPSARLWRLGAAGGSLPPGERSVATNTAAYLELCREAAAAGVDLLCLPEVMLTTGLPCDETTLPEQAIRLPGPEIEPFQAFAREHRMALCFSAWEREAELIHNTAILIGKTGELVGKYRKVHLASPYEVWWGVTPGHEFPVYDLDGAQVAMNICMDSSALESARVPARLGAEILCMPIMGDHRAVKVWDAGAAEFDLDRWTAIQRVRAMDNQLTMVISRNEGIGCGIFSPRGEVLALSQGERLVHAPVDLADLPLTWPGATFRGVAWWERREPTYGPLVGGPGNGSAPTSCGRR
jgi:predicted amidohydrolase